VCGNDVSVTFKTFDGSLGILNQKQQTVDGIVNSVTRDIGETIEGVHFGLVCFANPRDAGFGFD
jgi:hypothetical protein